MVGVISGLVKIDERDGAPRVEGLIPLISVDVVASVVHAVGQVEVSQVYVNKEEQPIEAIYYFPVNPDGAVTRFQAELEGRVIKGIVKESEEATADYENAIKSHKTALLGEEIKADIFKVRVGFLKPGEQVKVLIGYVTEVKVEPDSSAIRFYIPTTIAPRYVSPSESGEKVAEFRNMSLSASSPVPLSIKVAVSLQGGIRSIESPTHSVKINNAGSIPQNLKWHKGILELSGDTGDMDRDFVLNIVPEEMYKPRLYSEKREDGSTAVMVHVVPSFRLDEQKSELIFVLDRSGSMGGRSIELARKALLLFLHSMPADCYFNIIGFGSSFQFLFPQSVKYDESSMRAAIEHAKFVQANLGGTEILEPLKTIYSNPKIEGYLRQIFVLTDGEVLNTEAVTGIVAANAHDARVFTLGIGDAASHELVEGVAKAGGGTSAFVTYNESIGRKVLNQLKNGLQPSLTDIQVEWEGLKCTPASSPTPPDNVVELPQQSPRRVPPVYDGSQMLVFGLFQEETPSAVTIKAESPDGPLALRIENSEDNDVGSTNMLHRLAAAKLIRELELECACLAYQENLGDEAKEEESLRRKIIDISCRNGISSKHTSFIAIDTRDNKVASDNWIMVSRHVSSQLPPSSTQDIDSRRGSSNILENKGCALLTTSSSFESREAPPSPQITRPATPKSMKPNVNVPFVEGGCSLRSESCSSCISNMLSGDTNEYIVIPTRQPKTGPPPVTPKKLAKSKSVDQSPCPLDSLISLQSYDGSYNLSESLGRIVGKPLEVLEAGAAKHNLSQKQFATALAIVFFVSKLNGQKDVWYLIVKKAKKWLESGIHGERLKGVLRIASTYTTKHAAIRYRGGGLRP